MFFVNLKFSVKNNILSRLDNNKVVNKCNGLISSHNSDSNAHSLSTVARSGSYNDLLDKPVIPSANWSTQSLGSYGTLYVNETLRLVIFYYSRSYNYTSASDIAVETNIIPSNYRPSKSIPCSSASPYVAGRVYNGNLVILPTKTGQLATTVQAIWTY